MLLVWLDTMSRNLWFAEVFIAECDDVGLVQTFSIQKLPIVTSLFLYTEPSFLASR